MSPINEDPKYFKMLSDTLYRTGYPAIKYFENLNSLFNRARLSTETFTYKEASDKQEYS